MGHYHGNSYVKEGKVVYHKGGLGGGGGGVKGKGTRMHVVRLWSEWWWKDG